MKPRMVQIILVQMKDKGVQFRIAKLVGAVSVQTTVGDARYLHVGDVIDEKVAQDLSECRVYEVTVTEKAGR